MVVDDEFQSQPCPTIHYTYDETLEGSSWCDFIEWVQTHSILVWQVGAGQSIFFSTHDSKRGSGDHFINHIPISTLSNHSLYIWWDIGRVKLMWIAWISPNSLNLGVKHKGQEPEIVTTCDSKVRVWRWLWMMNSNLNLVQPFIIHMMRHWKGQADVNCLNQSKLTQSWCET